MAVRLRGASSRERVVGSELVPAVLATAAQQGLTVGSVGGLDGAAQRAAEQSVTR